MTDHRFIQHGPDREDTSVGPALLESALLLGREARAITRIRRHRGQTRIDAREPVFGSDDRRGVDVQSLSAFVPRLQVESEGDRNGDGLLEGQCAFFRTASFE